MYKKFDFTYDKNTFADLPQFVEQIHNRGKKFVVIVVCLKKKIKKKSKIEFEILILCFRTPVLEPFILKTKYRIM